MQIGDTFEIKSDFSQSKIIYKLVAIRDGLIVAECHTPTLFYGYTAGFKEFEEDMLKGKVFNYKSITGKPPCFHKWAKYIGFTRVYDYCTKCDHKRETK